MMRKRLIHGTSWAIFSRILAIGLSLFFNMMIARMLTPSEMGSFFLALSLVSFFSVLGQIGLPQVVVRLVAESISINMFGRAKQAIYKSLIISTCSGSCVAMVFYFGLGGWISSVVLHSNTLYLIVGLISFSILINSIQGVITETYRGFHDIKAASLISSVLPQVLIVGILAVLWLIHKHVTLSQVFILTIISSIVVLFTSLFLLRKNFSELGTPGKSSYFELLSIGLPLCAIQITVFIATQADLWIVGSFLSEQDVAIYGSTQKLLLLLTMTHSLMIAVAQSSVSELFIKGEKRKLEIMIQTLTIVACFPSFLILSGYLFFGEDILTFVFGVFYKVAFVPLLILAIGQFLSMLMGPADMLLVMTGFQKKLMPLIIVGSILRILLAILLTLSHGLLGLSFAWALGAVIQSYLIKEMCVRNLDVKPNISFSTIKSFYNKYLTYEFIK